MAIVLFDFDGVLVRRDSFESYLRMRLRRQPWRLLAVFPMLPLLPLLLSSVRVKGWLARVLMRVATCGLDEMRFQADIRAFGRRFIGIPGIAVHQAVARLREHLNAGDRVLVVSATAQPLLNAMLDELGLGGAVEALGSSVAVRWSGVHALFHNYGRAKIVTLTGLGLSPPWAAVYTDSRSDLPMLVGAQRSVLVNPSARDLHAVRAALGAKLEIVEWIQD